MHTAELKRMVWNIVADEFARDSAPLPKLDPALVWAIILVESSGIVNAYRHEPGFYTKYLKDKPWYRQWSPRRTAASYGLMQIMFPTACDMGWRGDPEELFVPETNIRLGCQYLVNLRAKLPSWDAATCAYNGGVRGNRLPPYRNASYLAKVHAAMGLG
jgi:soluble lytic murein transglycosylase-like protein